MTQCTNPQCQTDINVLIDRLRSLNPYAGELDDHGPAAAVAAMHEAATAIEAGQVRIRTTEAAWHDAERQFADLNSINANLMGDDETVPRYTTKRLHKEIERHRQQDLATIAEQKARIAELEPRT